MSNPPIIDLDKLDVKNDLHFDNKAIRAGQMKYVNLKVFNHDLEKDVNLYIKGPKCFLPCGITGWGPDLKYTNSALLSFDIKLDPTTGEWIGSEENIKFYNKMK